MKKLKTSCSLIVLFLLCTYLSVGQIFNYSYTTDEQTYSSKNNMVIDAKGNTVAVSTIREYNFSNEYDAHVIKADDNGNVIWARTYGMPGADERANAICETDDKGYIITGVKDVPGKGYGTWIFKIDVNGNLQWSEWFGLSNVFISEGFVVTRTFEGAENYLIAGTAEYPRRIAAIKIDGLGNMIWSQQYYDPGLVNSKWDFVTGLTEDRDNDGYIIVGTEHDYYTTGFSTLDLFTFGIDLNGNPTRPYLKYDLDVGDYEFSPSITRGFEEDGYVISFGTRAGSVQPGTVSLISFMKLDDGLMPQWTNLYASPNAYESNANSVYVDPHGFYDMSVFMYQGGEGGGEGGGVRNAAFLRLDLGGNPVYHWRYNIDQDQTCTFMAQDFTALHENYVLKTDHVANGTFSVGLIRTELYGESECSEPEPINVYPVNTNVTLQHYKHFFLAKNNDVPTKKWKETPDQIHCQDLFFSAVPGSSFSVPGEGQLAVQSTSEQQSTATVFPSLISEDNAAITVNFTAGEAGIVNIKVFDSLGKQISESEHAVYTGLNKFSLEGLTLPKGLNTVVIYQDNEWKTTEKVIRL